MGIKDNKLINESLGKNPKPFFIWLGVLLAVLACILGLQYGLKKYLEEKVCESPFNRVTNRQFSVFLWQNPRYMRANAQIKSGYLPAFQYLSKVSLEPELADDFVQAPPKVLFRYHTWERQVGDIYFPRRIDPGLFADFLDYAEEWTPKYWEKAPEGYVRMVKNLPNLSAEDLQKLPLEVKQSFEGWLNYFKEGEKIESVSPTYGEMEAFLKKYPHFARNYWKNVVSDDYLKSYASGQNDPNDVIPSDEVAGFLKAAFYNYQQSL